jgi:hypothetical protein
VSELPKPDVLTLPPAELIPQLTEIVTQASAGLSPHAKGGVFALGTKTQQGTLSTHAAVVVRNADRSLAVVTWIGKDWSAPGVGGGAALKWEF